MILCVVCWSCTELWVYNKQCLLLHGNHLSRPASANIYLLWCFFKSCISSFGCSILLQMTTHALLHFLHKTCWFYWLSNSFPSSDKWLILSITVSSSELLCILTRHIRYYHALLLHQLAHKMKQGFYNTTSAY